VVVTGFLGSGKTTLVNALLRKQSDSLVIVNEFGEVPVDHALVENSVEKAIALPNGCLCCHLRGDLEETLIGAAMRRRRGDIAGFDRVIVETSVDRANDSGAAEAEVRALNPGVPCIRAEFGEVDPRAILEAKPGIDHVFAAAAHDSRIRSFALRFGGPVRRELLQRFLATLVELRGADLLRVKGIVPTEDGMVLVQGVRHVFDRLRPVDRGEPALVFITHAVDKSEVQALWDAMNGLSCKAL